MKALFTAFTGGVSSIFGGLYGYLAIAVVCGGLGAFGTYKVMHNANEAAVTQQAKATVQYVVKQGAIQTKLVTVFVPKYIAVQNNTNRILQETPAHVTPQIDAAYPVPLGFVRVFNDAAHGVVPPASAGSDADPSGVPLSDVAGAHTADEGTLDTCRTMNDEWWNWYDQHSAAWNKANGQ